MRYLVYNEPSEHGDVEVKMSEAEALKVQLSQKPTKPEWM